MKEQYTVYKSTKENWYPTGEKGLQCFASRLSDGTYRVSLWGDDDFGIERDNFATFDSAKEFLKSIPEPVEREWLYQNGFIHS